MSRFAPMKSPTRSSKSPIRIKSPKSTNINSFNNRNSINSNSNNNNSNSNNNNNSNSNSNNNRKENEIPTTLFAPTLSSSIKEKDPIAIDPLVVNTQATKRKSFVTIVKPAEVFGEPPPIPRPTYNISPEKIIINNEQDASSVINAVKLQKQSVRWLNLSATFWYLIVIDTERTVNKENLGNFFEVIKWRAHDKINEDEFSALYSEWISKSNSNVSRRSVVGIFIVRQMLIENSCTESDLDLYIGMIMNETNKYTLHVPINYIPRIDSVYQPTLELVSSKWLNLAEELFFCLDTPGYGVLRFDEIFFFSSCLAIGLQGWQNESELETDLSLGLLSAITLQLLRDMGANIQLTSLRQELISLGHSDLEVTVTGSENVLVDGVVNRPIRNGASISPLKQPVSAYKRQSITMRMFKQYFLKKGINEGTLAALVVHVKMCIERLARITNSKSASLFSSSKPVENQRVIGSPRLWQQAVLLAFGYNSDHFEKNKNMVRPPILLFLLSDADKLISGALRAYEHPLDSIDSLQNTASQSFRRVRLSTYEEMHETCHRIWSAFKNWGVNKTKGVYAGFSNSESISDKQSDPIYQLIVSTMIEYKNLQLQLCAALYDLTMTHYGLQNSSNPISFVCSSLLPNAEAMIVELGLDEAQDYFEQEIVEVNTESKQKSPESATNSVNKNSIKSDSNAIVTDFNKQNSSASPISNEKPQVAFKSLYLEFEANKSVIKEESTRESFSKDPKSKPEGRADLLRKAQWERIFDSREEEKYPIETGFMENKPTNDNVFVPINRDMSDSYDDVLRNISNDEQVSNDSAVLKFQQQEAIILQQLLSSSNPDEQQAYITKLRQRFGVDGSINYNSNTEKIVDKVYGNNDVIIDESNSNSDNEIKSYENVSKYSIPYTQQLQDNNLYSISTDEILENNYNNERVDSPMTYSNKSEASASTNGPSSIADLLETGQSAGKYAQGLREILRKMAKNDSKVKVDSLEQIIKLGQEIIVKESPTPKLSASKSLRRSSMPSELDTIHGNNTPLTSNNNINNNSKNKLNQRRNTIELTALRRHIANNYITPIKNDGSITRTIKSVPGNRLPEQKNDHRQMAFGHRL